MKKMAKTDQQNVYNSLYTFCFFVCCCLNAAKMHAGETDIVFSPHGIQHHLKKLEINWQPNLSIAIL